MSKHYFAMLDAGTVQALGKHEDFDGADDKSPANTVWIFDEPDLLKWIASAQEAIATARSSHDNCGNVSSS